MSNEDILILILLGYGGVMTGLWFDAKREIRISKHVLLTLVRDKEERARFFSGFEKILEGKLND